MTFMHRTTYEGPYVLVDNESCECTCHEDYIDVVACIACIDVHIEGEVTAAP